MSRKAKIDDEIGGDKVLDDEEQKRANSDPAKQRRLLNRIAKWQAKIDGMMAKAKTDCAPMRDEIKKIKKEAAELGFERARFNELVKRERLKLALANVGMHFDDEARHAFDQECEQLDLFDQQQDQKEAA